MKLTYYVNTMLLLESEHSRILCDPWVTTGLESRSGLFNFPELTTTKQDLTEINPDFIYITHTHADHYDPDTLAMFPRDTTILVSWYEHNFTAKAMKRLGFTDVRISDPEKGIALNGSDHVWIEPNAIYSAVDSMAVFKLDDKLLLNANDCPYDENQCQTLVERFGKIDIACVPFGFQGPYPAFYENLTLEEKKSESNKKKFRNYEIVFNYLETIKPEYYFPLTGGAVYGGKKALMMEYCGVGTAEELIQIAEERNFKFKALLMSELSTYDFTTDNQTGTYVKSSHASSADYLKRISETPGPFDENGLFWVSPSERIDLSPLLEKAREKQAFWQKRLNISADSVYFIDVGQPTLYRLSLNEDSVSRVNENDITEDTYEIFRVPYSLMVAMLTRHYNYSNVKTQFIDFYRKPNTFNQNLHILMSHLHL
ncbi:MAG: MBL fold metallo-hydrolase [Methylococcales bacterium]|jgi:hypothetical protein|nr:MBL fold metallo-hydrolase [Methylococcales bacterium]MBT7445688.1 MBL fold metallo-hydrolase [Methylococcales bacterium]